MNIFTNKDTKKFIITVLCVLFAFTCLSQLLLIKLWGKFSVPILLITILFSVCILWLCFSYFKNQQRKIDIAERTINDFLDGNTDARVDCNEEGSLYKLFHAVNTLATSLNAHVANEKQIKEFLKNTISDISHQLKTPLSALYIYNELLQNESANETAVKDFSVKSEKELDRIETLVQNLLKITKLDAGTITLKLENENIAALLNRAVQSFEAQTALEHKRIILDGSNSVTLYCDVDWICEVISNIIKNALEHIDVDGQIFIRWQTMSALTRITISDNGAGIQPEDIHHIFKRFYRSKNSKNIQGIGLGLSLAKAVIEAHNGTITVESHVGNGTTFTLDFPNLTKL